MIRVFVPAYRQVEIPNGRRYIVYCVEVTVSGVCHRLERRYSTFHSLHKKVKRMLGSQAPSGFPPKRLRGLNPKLLEQRRAGLERYLQDLVRIPALSSQLLSFLEVPAPLSPAVSNSVDSDDQEFKPLHQPILGFPKDPYLDTSSSDSLPDIVMQGVMNGLFAGYDYDD
ncbi:sorting nexin-24-like [Amblyomma americanum]|uniref:PX domain-containing protein n=2 Tax=Amblyomma americanum TaxID=6943 RepID=A0AAQ4F7R8_AMBAM